MDRLLGRVIAVVLVAGIATLGVMGRQTTPTALGRWLGPAGAAALVPGRLTPEAPVVGDILDAGARRLLATDAAQLTGLATYLDGRGTPPSHVADVRALERALRAYASAATGLSACVSSCRGPAIALDAQGATVLRLVAAVHDAATRRRL